MRAHNVIGVVGIALGAILLLLMLFVPHKARAATDATLVSRDGKVHLYDTPCDVASILARFPEHRFEMKAGTLEYEGRTIAGCWVMGTKMAFLIDEDGDLSRIPLTNLLPVKVL